MADLALGVASDIINTGKAIKDAVDTFQENEKECQDILELVSVLKEILLPLQEMGLTSHPTMCRGALMRLHRSLGAALKLVTKWQKRNGMHRFLRARDMAKQLRRVQYDINQNMNIGILAATIELRIEWTRITTTTVQYEGAHPPPTQLQNAAEMEMYSSHSTTGDAGSYDNEIITMVTTGTEAHSAPSTGFTLSETVATHHVSEENMNGVNSCTRVVKQKIVFKVSMAGQKRRIKALKLVGKLDGVISMGITGDGKDLLEVVGNSVDAVCLVNSLSKKIGHAMILQVEELKDKKPEERKPEEPKVLQGESSSSMTFRDATPQDCNNQHQEHAGASVHQVKASGDLIEKPQLQLQELRPVEPPARVHRGAPHSRMMKQTQPALSSQRWGARVLHWLLDLLVPCALCALVLLASVWALR